MRINLQFFMAKQRVTLEEFCELNSLRSYEELVKHCENRNIKPVTREVYDMSFPPEATQKSTVVKPEKKVLAQVPEQPVQEKAKSVLKRKPQRRRRTKKTTSE